jgi:AbrB family looped-hinge helix DNA binding protein
VTLHVAVMDRRGRVVLPQPVRQALGLRPGDSVFFAVTPGGVQVAAAPTDMASYLALLSGGERDDRDDASDAESDYGELR